MCIAISHCTSVVLVMRTDKAMSDSATEINSPSFQLTFFTLQNYVTRSIVNDSPQRETGILPSQTGIRFKEEIQSLISSIAWR